MSDVHRLCQEYLKDFGVDFNINITRLKRELLEHFETSAVQEQSDGNKFFWYSLKACKKCSNVPTSNQTTSLKHCKFQELQVIFAGRCLHMNISSFQVPSHEIAKAYLFLTISNFSLQ